MFLVWRCGYPSSLTCYGCDTAWGGRARDRQAFKSTLRPALVELGAEALCALLVDNLSFVMISALVLAYLALAPVAVLAAKSSDSFDYDALSLREVGSRNTLVSSEQCTHLCFIKGCS